MPTILIDRFQKGPVLARLFLECIILSLKKGIKITALTRRLILRILLQSLPKAGAELLVQEVILSRCRILKTQSLGGNLLQISRKNIQTYSKTFLLIFNMLLEIYH